jgi:hypothetical protein
MLRECKNSVDSRGSMQDRLSRYYRNVRAGNVMESRKGLMSSAEDATARLQTTKRGQSSRESQLSCDRISEDTPVEKFNTSDNYGLRHAAIDVLLQQGISCRDLPAKRSDRRWRHLASMCDLSNKQIELLQEMSSFYSTVGSRDPSCRLHIYDSVVLSSRQKRCSR